jgi:hypothetical protein
MFLKTEIFNCIYFIVASITIIGKRKGTDFLLKKVFSYAFSGFSIVFIGYVLINILNSYPPRIIGISP